MQTLITGAFIFFPLSLIQRMSGLRFLSIVSLVAMIFLLMLIVFEMPSYVDEYHDRPDTELIYAKVDMNIF